MLSFLSDWVNQILEKVDAAKFIDLRLLGKLPRQLSAENLLREDLITTRQFSRPQVFLETRW